MTLQPSRTVSRVGFSGTLHDAGEVALVADHCLHDVSVICHASFHQANSTLIRNAFEDLLGEDFEGRFESKYLARTI
ncbi:hypothetical protein, partial [Xanthomonas oryzae]|uniref:hypothetical protein n=1 Tax=Xanthomonas oryzae TaxID=347 RepID=UPI001C4C740F